MEFLKKPGMNMNVINATAIPLLYLPASTVGVTNGTTSDLEKKYLQLCQENAILRKQNQENNQLIDKQNNKIKLLENRIAEMDEQKVKEKITSLESDLEAAKDEINRKTSEMKKIRKDLRNLLSETQLELLTEKKEKVHWSADDMAKAFTIYYFSKKCYLYLKHNLKYPLPGIPALEQWASKSKVVLRIPAYEIFKGLEAVRENPERKRRRL